jgi:hypothetical protein
MTTITPANARAFVIVPIFLVAFVVTSCSKQKHAAPVDAKMAQESLRTVLESWKKGDDPGSLRQGKPSITVQDLDWKAGYVLLDFEIVGEGKFDDANLLCPVKLRLRDPQGKEVTREVTYMVGTDPVITVFREMKM